MRDYPNILVAFLERFDEGYEFERWPHHITILPWFKADKKALASVESLSEEYLPISAELAGTAMFGHRKDIMVRLVESERLDEFHRSLISRREGLLGLVNTSHTNDSFKAHVTLQGTGDPAPGPIRIERVSLVKKVEPGRTKRVITNYKNS